MTTRMDLAKPDPLRIALCYNVVTVPRQDERSMTASRTQEAAPVHPHLDASVSENASNQRADTMPSATPAQPTRDEPAMVMPPGPAAPHGWSGPGR